MNVFGDVLLKDPFGTPITVGSLVWSPDFYTGSVFVSRGIAIGYSNKEQTNLRLLRLGDITFSSDRIGWIPAYKAFVYTGSPENAPVYYNDYVEMGEDNRYALLKTHVDAMTPAQRRNFKLHNFHRSILDV